MITIKKLFGLYFSLFIILLSISVYFSNVFAEDYLDRLMESCSNGNDKACNEIDELAEKYKEQIDKLNKQADNFQADSSLLGIENNGKPNITKAYPIILKRYMSSDTVEPIHKQKGVKPELVEICSKRLNELYFIHGKEIPLLESGKPDWGVIYLVVIEHYFRHCSIKL